VCAAALLIAKGKRKKESQLNTSPILSFFSSPLSNKQQATSKQQQHVEFFV